MEPLGKAVLENGVASVIVTGATSKLISDAFLSVGVPEGIYKVVPDFGLAVLEAAKEAERTCADTVLLSPACASFDAFANFEERGSYYKAVVNSLR